MWVKLYVDCVLRIATLDCIAYKLLQSLDKWQKLRSLNNFYSVSQALNRSRNCFFYSYMHHLEIKFLGLFHYNWDEL